MDFESLTPADRQELEQLILRFTTAPYDSRNQNSRIFIGKIPENFPSDVPVPTKARVLGTLVRSEAHVEIVLESDLPADEVSSFYQEKLASQGWKPLEDFPHRMGGGFLHTSIPGPSSYLTFCQGENEPALTLNVVQLENKATDIRLHFNFSQEGNPCSQQRRRRQRHHLDILPSLAPPAGAQQRGGGGSSGDTECYTHATLKTSVALDALAQHYGEQLAKARWTKIDADISGPIAWQTWSFNDEDQQPWNALFFIMQKPGKAQNYTLFLRAELDSPENDNRFSGWLRSSSGNSTTLGGFLFRANPS